MAKVKSYAEYFGISLIEAYYELIDCGEIRESESLRAKCAKLSPALNH